VRSRVSTGSTLLVSANSRKGPRPGRPDRGGAGAGGARIAEGAGEGERDRGEPDTHGDRAHEGPADAAAELVSAAVGGDRAAFGRLFRLYGPMVHGVLLARVPPHEVRDLMQDVFVTALERLDTLREAGAFGGWLAMIARNRATDFHRREQHRRTAPLEGADVAVRDPDRAQAEQLLALIRQLPDAYKETLVLRLVEGMTGPEIAARVGLTPESVRVNLHRGMALLRQRLGEEVEP
jgi:RNA polymerase sigma-70 factor (ECF subfamily)